MIFMLKKKTCNFYHHAIGILKYIVNFTNSLIIMTHELFMKNLLFTFSFLIDFLGLMLESRRAYIFYI
jgi:hypothetical protein